MSKLLLVARHEYLYHIRRKGFLFATFGLPALMGGLLILLALLIVRAERVSGLGYVDYTELSASLAGRVVVGGELGPPVPVVRYGDEATARSALKAGEIDAYFVIPKDYLASGEVVGYALRRIPDLGRERFEELLQRILLDHIPGDDPRLVEPIAEMEVLTIEGAPTNPIVSFLMPFLYAILLMVSSFTSSGYLMQSLVEEKENRIIEILATSLSPGKLMGGKIIGLGLLGMTQLGVWVLSGVAALLAAAASLDMQGISLPTDTLLLMLALFVPSYLLFAATLSAVGAAVTATQEGQQIASIVSVLGISPVWFFGVLFERPGGAVALALSLFPFTAPVSLLLRRAVSSVPLWQIVLSLLILVASALAMVWVAGRVLRYGMLRYGKRVGLRELARAVRRS